jgi:hypothetical protein
VAYDPKAPSSLNYSVRWIERPGQKRPSQLFANTKREANDIARAAKRKGFTEIEVKHTPGVARRLAMVL